MFGQLDAFPAVIPEHLSRHGAGGGRREEEKVLPPGIAAQFFPLVPGLIVVLRGILRPNGSSGFLGVKVRASDHGTELDLLWNLALLRN